MAFQKVKGALVKLDISSVLTTIAQCTELDLPSKESLSSDVTTLDQTDEEEASELTGYTKHEWGGFGIFFDPGLSPHATIESSIDTPVETIWQIALANTDASTYDFTCTGLKFEPSLDGRNHIKAKITPTIKNKVTFAV